MRKNGFVQISFSLGEEKKREHKRQHTSARKVARHISEEATEVPKLLSQNSLAFTFSLNVKGKTFKHQTSSMTFSFFQHIPVPYPFIGIFLCFSHFSDSVDIVINIFLKRNSKIFKWHSHFFNIYPFNGIFLCFLHLIDDVDIVINIFFFPEDPWRGQQASQVSAALQGHIVQLAYLLPIGQSRDR